MIDYTSRPDRPEHGGLRVIAWTSFYLHAIFVMISVVAFWFVIGSGRPDFIPADLWARSYNLGLQYTGILYIATGFAAALCGWLAVIPWGRALAGAAAVIALSLGAELIGTYTGMPFGPYSYGSLLGDLILDLVPIVIPLSWFMMLYASFGVALRLDLGTLGTIVAAALGLVAWDVLMDPAMSAVFPFWQWHVDGVFYGMPLINWFGWMVTGLVIATAAMYFAGSAIEGVGRQSLPLYLYVVNGLFPLALLLEEGLYGVALLGGGVMMLYLVSPLLLGRLRAADTSNAPGPA